MNIKINFSFLINFQKIVFSIFLFYFKSLFGLFQFHLNKVCTSENPQKSEKIPSTPLVLFLWKVPLEHIFLSKTPIFCNFSFDTNYKTCLQYHIYIILIYIYRSIYTLYNIVYYIIYYVLYILSFYQLGIMLLLYNIIYVLIILSLSLSLSCCCVVANEKLSSFLLLPLEQKV